MAAARVPTMFVSFTGSITCWKRSCYWSTTLTLWGFNEKPEIRSPVVSRVDLRAVYSGADDHNAVWHGDRSQWCHHRRRESHHHERRHQSIENSGYQFRGPVPL